MKFGLITIAFGAAFCLAVEGADPWKWSEKGQGSVSIKGVCSIDPDKVTCWDKAGKQDKRLAESVASELIKSSTKLEARFGSKNRYLIADIKNERGGMGINFASDTGMAYQSGKLVLMAMPQDSKSANLKIVYRKLLKNPPKLEPKEGATFTRDGQTVSIVKVTMAKAGGQAFGIVSDREMPVWRLFLDVKGMDMGRVSLKAIPADGKEFAFVGPNGRPIPGQTARTTDNPVIPIMQLMMPFGEKTWYIDTNIDPAQLKAIEFRSIESREYKIENIPLDPKR